MKPSLNLTAILLVTALLFGGCALTQVVVPVKKETMDTVKSSEVKIVVEQQEIYAHVNRSNITGAMGGGILWALIDSAIDSSRSEDADKELQPIKNMLLEINTQEILKNNYSKKLKNVAWLNAKSFSIETKDLQLEERKKVTVNSVNNAVLFVNIKYFLTSDYKTLKVMVSAEMYPNTKELQKLGVNNFTDESMLYKNSYTYEYSIPDNNLEKDGILNKWVSDDSNNIAKVLERGFESVTNWLANDLQAAKHEKLAKN
ncbi:MAG: hypothetical protein OEY52_09095 [Gammaproteobacteria bacterium]|nr:hypothetical protein [Gammaproteobacteria bacterium]